MNKVINIKSKKAINEIQRYKDKKYFQMDIKFENVHLREINKLLPFVLFEKNDLYINSVTLWELMQETGNAGTHNYHGLTPSDIFCVLNSIDEPYCIFEVKNERYAIVPTYISSFYEPLMVVIEKEAELINRKNANVNKIVTIYPKSKIDKYLSKIDNKAILYIKKWDPNGAPIATLDSLPFEDVPFYGPRLLFATLL